MPIEVAPSLADVLTLAGAALAAPLVTTLVEMLKRVKGLGDYIRAHSLEQSLALAASLLLVVVASVDRHQRVGSTTLEDAFASFIAWLVIAKLATGLYDEVVANPGSFREPATEGGTP